MTDHDEFCHARPTKDPEHCAECKQLAAVRADERARRDAYWQPRLETAWVQLDETTVPILRARTALVGFRAKVEALGIEHYHAMGYNSAITDVLALLDGSSDD